MFSTLLKSCLLHSSNLKLSSANSFNMEESKICRLEKGLVAKLILGMKVHLIDTYLLVSGSRSHAKVKVQYEGNFFSGNGRGGFWGHWCLTNTAFYSPSFCLQISNYFMKSVEQDQPIHMSSLILLWSLHNSIIILP